MNQHRMLAPPKKNIMAKGGDSLKYRYKLDRTIIYGHKKSLKTTNSSGKK